jgi:hypothetical protein
MYNPLISDRFNGHSIWSRESQLRMIVTIPNLYRMSRSTSGLTFCLILVIFFTSTLNTSNDRETASAQHHWTRRRANVSWSFTCLLTRSGNTRFHSSHGGRMRESVVLFIESQTIVEPSSDDCNKLKKMRHLFETCPDLESILDNVPRLVLRMFYWRNWGTNVVRFVFPFRSLQ